MMQEEKQLLLKDLCARLPYGVMVNCDSEDEMLFSIAERGFLEVNDRFLLKNTKPYLRPMSSMTEEEENKYNSLNAYEKGVFPHTEDAFDWLNSHHFDYRGLIEKGLALEAPVDMYKNE